MGGYYSGRWHWYTRKTTVEECSKVSIREFDHTLLAHRFEAGDPIYYDESRSARMSAWIARKVVGDLFGKNGEPVRERPKLCRETPDNPSRSRARPVITVVTATGSAVPPVASGLASSTNRITGRTTPAGRVMTWSMPVPRKPANHPSASVIWRTGSID